ncbi:glycosyltransferase family 25 protein [Rhizobium sp. Leaf341]|uniref:glycosyltransferase family 25 protein n=1 Tax=Rhizobium sp. Leaf341 TaxID=1736344 RepID=UPI000713880C|nr:glycosyltransferase family 25 protein [Rhizobium sp. Leaf341]KQR68714.1 hypothetical protein ASG03_05465 [Rhizobium sp. Leaf341]
MRCLIINLDRSPERWQHVLAEFERQGLVPERVSAVDANRLPAVALPSLRRGWKPLTDAEVACFLSHRACWRLVADGSDPVVAIFEDDIVLAEGAGALLSTGNIHTTMADLVKIESHGQPVLLSRHSFTLAEGYRHHRLSSLHLGSAGYLLTKDGAIQLLALAESRVPCQIDHFLFDPSFPVMRYMKVHQMVPALVKQGRLLPTWASALGSTIRDGIRPTTRLAPSSKIRREAMRLIQQLAALPKTIPSAVRYVRLRLDHVPHIVPAHCRTAETPLEMETAGAPADPAKATR